MAGLGAGLSVFTRGSSMTGPPKGRRTGSGRPPEVILRRTRPIENHKTGSGDGHGNEPGVLRGGRPGPAVPGGRGRLPDPAHRRGAGGARVPRGQPGAAGARLVAGAARARVTVRGAGAVVAVGRRLPDGGRPALLLR